MHILRELWTKEVDSPDVKNSYQYVFELRDRLEKTLEIAQSELRKSQYKHYYDRGKRVRKLSEGDQVLVLLPTDHNKVLMQWKGPFKVESIVGRNDYKIKVKGKSKIYHINLLKKYVKRGTEENTDQEDKPKKVKASGSLQLFVTQL